MKVFEVTDNFKQSLHRIKGDPEKFRQNLGMTKLLQKVVPGEELHAKNKLVKTLGQGVYATAVMKSNKPDEVYKISRPIKKLESDPYYQYLRQLASNKSAAYNPFLPKIKQVKIYQSDDKQYPYFYIVRMERLYHLELLDEEDLIKLIIQLTTPKMSNRILGAIGAYNGPEELKKLSHTKLIILLVDKISEEKIKNPQLRAAINIIASTRMEFDITSSNIMYRNTPTGVQLVLADPVRT